MRKNVKRLVKGGLTGKRLCGYVYELASGAEVYLASRKIGDVFRPAKQSVADAMSEGVACWSIEQDILTRMRIEGVKLIGVLVKETGDIFITTRTNFEGNGKMVSGEGRNSALQRYLPLSSFGVTLGSSRVKRPVSRSRK